MKFSEDVAQLFADAYTVAIISKYEYVTPEVILLVLCKDEEFVESFEESGGDVQKLAKDLKGYCEENLKCKAVDKPETSDGVSQMLYIADISVRSSGRDTMGLTHLIHGMYSLEDCYATYFMAIQGVTEVDLLQSLADIEDELDEFDLEDYEEDEEPYEFNGEEEGSFKLESYAPCMNDMLEGVNPLIGRETELERTMEILCRKDKNNPLHIGEPGVGKTAITYGLVRLINENKVPKELEGAKVFALDLASMLAGTQYRGDFEKRVKKVLEKISKEEKPIVYIDEIHNLAGAGATGEGSMDASNMLKPYLAQGHVRFIGATTFEEYKKYFEKNKSLVRRFQNVEIPEPGIDETIQILNGLKANYEKFHGIKYGTGVLEYAAKMSAKYINERFLPDKAIDLLDEAGAYRKLHPLDQKSQTVGKDVIDEVLTKICRIPIEATKQESNENLATLDTRIKAKVFGQDEAVAQVVNAVKFSKAGLLEDNKPLSSLLFVGPTGVGKTEIAKTLASELGVKLVRFDMSEYGEKQSVAKLIGSPAGYVGYEEGGLLTEAIRKSPTCVLLFDEIEKAHPDIYHVLLQVMDYATLTDNQGRKADFRNVIIIMTSNAGASQIGKTGLGFASHDVTPSIIMDEVKRVFQPEFRNRLNRIVVFNGMSDDMAMRIAKKKLGDLGRLLEAKKVEFKWSEEAAELLKKKGTSREFGAREVDRVISSEIKTLLVDELLYGRLKNGGNCTLEVKEDKFCI